MLYTNGKLVRWTGNWVRGHDWAFGSVRGLGAQFGVMFLVGFVVVFGFGLEDLIII